MRGKMVALAVTSYMGSRKSLEMWMRDFPIAMECICDIRGTRFLRSHLSC